MFIRDCLSHSKELEAYDTPTFVFLLINLRDISNPVHDCSKALTSEMANKGWTWAKLGWGLIVMKNRRYPRSNLAAVSLLDGLLRLLPWRRLLLGHR